MTRVQHDDRYLSPTEVCSIYGIGRSFIYSHLRYSLPVVRLSDSAIRFKKSDVDRWFAERTEQPARMAV